MITIKTPDGFELIASSPEEAAALYAAVRKTGGAASSQSHPAPVNQPAARPSGAMAAAESVTPIDPETAGTALRFLKAVRDGASGGGLKAEALLPVFGVDKPQGIGNKSARVNSLLKDSLGLKVESVYSNPKTPTGRVWTPGKHLSRAIDLIEQRLGAG
jgi:hypothetical protein